MHKKPANNHWYHFSCSIILFALRAVVEFIFFTPKASPFEPTRNQPYIGAVLASNIFCMVFHAFLIQPEASEDLRGFLHGGLFIDFIGQKPVPVFRLLCFDVIMLLVDFLMLGLIIERVKTAAISNPPSNTSTTLNAPQTSTDGDTAQPEGQEQDIDAEERGVVRGNEDTDADEASSPPPVVTIVDDDVNDERTTLLADPGDSTSGRDNHPLDSFASGQAVIMEMGLFSVIRDQWRYTTTPQRPAGNVASREAAIRLLRQRFGLQVGTDGQLVRVNPGT